MLHAEFVDRQATKIAIRLAARIVVVSPELDGGLMKR